MKLTTEQIEFIDQTLVLNGLKFDDIKLEVTDHIASEIEDLQDENTLSFEENLHMVINQWKTQLQPRFSGLIGFTNPRIMTEKCNKILKKGLFIVFVISFLVTLLVMVFARNSSYETILANYQLVLKSLCITEFCLVILAYILIWKSKYQTTYGYLIKKKTFGIVIFLFLIGVGVFPVKLTHPDLKTVFISHFFVMAYLLISAFYLQFAWKHLEFYRKLTLSK